jgi:dTDP-glucose 4,6-dehydratase
VNIGPPHEVSVLDLATTIRGLCGSSSEIVFVPRPEDDPSIRRPDVTLARELLGWEPRVDFLDGLKQTVDYLRTRADAPGE